MSHIYLKYFVLSPLKSDIYGEASCNAMMAYADTIEEGDPVFADEIRLMVAHARGELGDPGEARQLYVDEPAEVGGGPI